MTVSLCCVGIKVRCYCQVGKTEQGKFALEVAVKTLELYKKYLTETIINNIFSLYFEMLY